MANKLYIVFLHVALIALAATSAALVRQNRELLAQGVTDEPQLEIGASVEPIPVRSLVGEAQTLNWEATGADRLLLVFTTTCPACRENQDAWRDIYEDLGTRAEIIGISLDDAEATRAYRDRHALPFDVVLAEDRNAFTASYEVYSVPTTLHIAADGRVAGVWSGVLSAGQQKELASEFGRRTRNG